MTKYLRVEISAPVRHPSRQEAYLKYDVYFQGEKILNGVKDPEHAACREMEKRGHRGKIMTFDCGGTTGRMVLDIERASEKCVRELGLVLTTWEPFPTKRFKETKL